MQKLLLKINKKVKKEIGKFLVSFLVIFGLFFSPLLPLAPYAYAAFNPAKEINYQGKLTLASGVAVLDTNYSIVFSLYTVSSGGSAVWTETRSVATTNGLFSEMLGSGTPLTSTILNNTLYLGVKVGTDAEMTPRKKLGVVPAAFISEKSANIIGGNSTTLKGSIPYQSDTDTTSLLAPNTTTTKKFFSMTGDGTNGATPSWIGIDDTDIPTALTGKTYNGLSLTAATNGFTIAGGTTSKTLTVSDDATVSGTNTGGNTGDETQTTIKTKLGAAYAGVDGYLTGTDWSTFNSKQNTLTNPVTGTGTVGFLPKFTTTGSTIGDSQIYDNGANVGIGTGGLTPSQKLDVFGAIALNGTKIISLPDQSTLLGSLIYGTGGTHLSYVSGNNGRYNTLVGIDAGKNLGIGNSNTALGYGAGYSSNAGSTWTALGYMSGYSSSSGKWWTATGYQAGYLSTTGNNWTANGYMAGYSNSSGSGWTATGYAAGYSNKTGSNWITDGYKAGRYLADGITGAESFDNSTYIGSNTKVSANGVTNENVFGYDAIGIGSDSVTLGNDLVTTTALKGNVGIGTITPSAKLHIGIGTNAPGTAPLKLTSGTNLSVVEAGAMEYDGTDLFFTPSTTRETVAFISDITGASHNPVTINPTTPNGLSLNTPDTQEISLALASTSTNGALSSTDWNTFNGKQSALTFSTGLTNTGGTITVNTSQNISTLSNLTTAGFVQTTSGGVLSSASLTSGQVTGALGFTPENVANKVTSISGSSTDVQYPSAKLLYDQLALKAPLASPTFTGTVTLPVGLTGVLRADTGVVSIDSNITDLVDNLSYTKLADGTAGNLITWSATGAPALVTTGTTGQILTSNGAGTAPTFQTPATVHDAVTLGTSANGLSLSTQVLSLALASTSATGALSSTDWNTFNGKESVLTFSNGLTRSVLNDVHLGGTLTEATTITQGANAFTIANNGAANTTINLSSTGDFDVQDNGTSAFFVRDDGNVGIGTISPVSKLDVRDGNISLTDVDVVHGMTGYFSQYYGNLGAINGTDGGLNITGLSDTDAIGIQLRGVIGSATPSATTPAINLIANKQNGTTIGALGSTDMLLKVSNNTTSLLTVLGSGYTGIGTTTPDSKLFLGNAGTVATGFTVGRQTDSTNDNFNIYVKDTETVISHNENAADAAAGYGEMTFTTNAAEGVNPTYGGFTFKGPTNTFLRILNDGKVGIGTATPSSLLSVGSTSQFQVNSSGAIAAAAGITSSGTISFSGLATDAAEATALLINSSNQLVYRELGTAAFTNTGAYEVPLTFTNGLTRSVLNDVHLGGTLSEATTITQGAYAFNIANNGAANTTINLSSTGDFNVQDNGISALFVRDDGNVGIGTTGPISLLEVKAADTVTGVLTIGGGKVTVTSVGEINSQLDFRSNDASVASTNQIGGRIASLTEYNNGANTGLGFYTYNQGRGTLAEALRIDNGGNVGIGTTGPNYDSRWTKALSIESSGYTGLQMKGSTIGADGNVAGFDFYNGANLIGLITADRDTADNKGALVFFTSSGSIAERMRIDKSGNVGIGTTAPESALKVAGTTGLTWASGVGGTASFGLATFGNGGTGGSLWVNTPSLNTTFNSGLGITGSYGTPTSRSVVNINAYGVTSGGGYGSDLAFSTTLGPALNERMRIDMNGNVGIGTTTPGARLDVVDTITANSDVYGVRSNVQFSDMGFHNAYGGYFEANNVNYMANTIYGVYGKATDDNAGNAYGVYGDGNDGTGVYGISYYSTYGYGVHGIADEGTGVSGNSVNGTGVFASSTNGIGLSVSSTNGTAINSTSGLNSFAGVIAANGGITFDAATDTVGAHTLSGTLNANNNIITNIGNAGTDFIASTGALNLAGALTMAANANIVMTSGTGTFAQAYTGTGNAMSVTSSSTTANNKALNIAQTGAMTAGSTDYAGYFSNTGATGNNVGLYATASGGANNYAAIFDGGNVGIGTNSPGQLLQVSGASGTAISILTPWSTGAYGQFRFDNPGGVGYASSIRSYLAGDGGGGLQFFTSTGGSEAVKMTILSTGNVGIGMTGPIGKLDIHENSDADTELRIIGQAAYDPRLYLKSEEDDIQGFKMWYDNSAGDTYFDNIYSGATQPLPAIRFRTNVYGTPNSLVNAMTILHNGNVGIGITSPTSLLNVYSNKTGINPQIGIESGASASFPVLQLKDGRTSGMTWNIESGRQAGSFSIYGGGVGGAAQALTILPGSGNVGIGTTAPLSKLSVGGVGFASTGIYGTGDSYGLYGESADTGVIGYGNTMGVSGIGNSLGVFGQGTDLDFYGNGGEYGVGGDWCGTSQCLNGASDSRLKDNITTMGLVLDKVMELRPVSYNWNSLYTTRREGTKGLDSTKLGFIAQEVKNIFPEVITGEETATSYLGIDYSHMVPILTMAIQELNTKLNTQSDLEMALTEEIDVLNGKYAEIEMMNLKLGALTGEIVPTTGSEEETFMNDFFANVFVKVGDWLASADNGIKSIFARKISTRLLCIADEAGVETCVEKTQLDNLLANAGVASASDTTIVGGVSTDTPVATEVNPNAPVITLVGDATINLNIGDEYSELGANVVDDKDTFVGAVITGVPDTSANGIYAIHYNATDSDGNVAIEIIRNVIVGAEDYTLTGVSGEWAPTDTAATAESSTGETTTTIIDTTSETTLPIIWSSIPVTSIPDTATTGGLGLYNN